MMHFVGETDIVKAIIKWSRPTQILNEIVARFCLWSDLQPDVEDIYLSNSKDLKEISVLELSEQVSTPKKTKFLTKPVNVLKSMIDISIRFLRDLIGSI